MPVIAIAASYLPAENVWRCPPAYADAVRESGGVPLPVLLSAGVRLPSAADALLLPGGGDLAPDLYGEMPLAATAPAFSPNDAGEFSLLRDALARGLPVLGICRGMQSLNVFCGGTLWQDIATQIPRALHHGRGFHAVSVAAGSRLAGLIGAGIQEVNSAHHQAVRRLGQGLRIAAAAPDGVVEALEGENLIAVQWHPERMEAPMRRAIFGDFAALAENVQKSRRRAKSP